MKRDTAIVVNVGENVPSAQSKPVFESKTTQQKTTDQID